jgi:hypothetical protein
MNEVVASLAFDHRGNFFSFSPCDLRVTLVASKLARWRERKSKKRRKESSSSLYDSRSKSPPLCFFPSEMSQWPCRRAATSVMMMWWQQREESRPKWDVFYCPGFSLISQQPAVKLRAARARKC